MTRASCGGTPAAAARPPPRRTARASSCQHQAGTCCPAGACLVPRPPRGTTASAIDRWRRQRPSRCLQRQRHRAPAARTHRPHTERSHETAPAAQAQLRHGHAGNETETGRNTRGTRSRTSISRLLLYVDTQVLPTPSQTTGTGEHKQAQLAATTRRACVEGPGRWRADTTWERAREKVLKSRRGRKPGEP